MHFKQDKRGISNVVVFVLGLVIIVVVVSNVFLWNYEMNQLDWEKMQEDMTITNVERITRSSWFVAQSEYTLNKGNHASGNYTDTQTINDQYETFKEASDDQSWLTGWDTRVEITINSTDIDEVLTDFPVLVHLSSSSGENNDNVTSVFDEVGSDYNAVAYTTSDGTTRLYFEVEYWNATSEKAWVWVKVPSVSNTVDTDIYIYYDSAKDGSAYNSPTNVWDSNFLGVWHMQADASDSSSPQYNGTAIGSPSDVTGIIGGAQNFDAGTPDRYDTGTIPHGIGTGNFMMEAWVNRDVDTGQPYQGILTNNDYAPAMYVETGGLSVWGGYWGSAMAADHETTTGVWYYYVMKREGSTIYFYRNGVVEASSYTRSTSMSNAIFRFGASSASAVNHMDGAIDEARFSNTSRSAAWIKASYETERDDILDFGSEESISNWLSGWGKRVKITIDNNDVDNVLSDFPVLVYLSNSSGRNSDDISFVFDELQSDANRKKIAATTSNSTTQCYVEIEKWDDANEKAWLWVKVPSISNTTDTTLYLYYDASHADNTDYVGDPQSTPAQNIWSPKYSAVFHFTNNFNDSVDGDTPSNTPGAAFVAGKIANAGEFYVNGDEADYTTDDALGGTGAADDDVGTFAFWMRGNEASYDYIADIGYTSGFIPANYQGTANPYLQTWWGAWRGGGTGVVTLNEWHHVVVRWNAGAGFNMWVDGASYNSYSGARSIVVDKVTIGNHENHGAYEANAIIDEVRFVDDVQVSDAWIKASYESGKDDFASYGSEEELGVERNELDIVGIFTIDQSTYPLTYIQTVEIQLKYRANDTGENWYLKAYNWTAAAYGDSGFNSTAGHTPTTGWDYYAVNLTDQWNSYVQNNGAICIKIVDEGVDNNQTTIDIDFLGVRAVIDGTRFTFKNTGAPTSRLVSIWIVNSTLHQRYNIDLIINSAQTLNHTRADIALPAGPYTVKIVTERGNKATYLGS